MTGPMTSAYAADEKFSPSFNTVCTASKRVRGEEADAAVDGHELDVGALGHDHRVVDLLALHRMVGAHHREQRVRVLDDPHARAAVELLERVVGVFAFEISRRHARARYYCPRSMAADQINLGLLVLRVAVGVTMIAHGYNHIYRGGKIGGTAGWFESLGMKPGKLHAWLASLTELAAGFGLGRRLAHAARGRARSWASS